MARNRNRGKKPQNKKDYNKKDDSRSNDTKQDEVPSRTNDAAMYDQIPELAKAAADIAFSSPAGSPFNWEVEWGGQVAPSKKQCTPGILTLSVIPIPASDNSDAAPINVAQRSIYASVRQANSGSSTYDSPDLFLYCLSLSQVYSYINFLQRVYGLRNISDAFNRYMPKALASAQGVDYDNLNRNLANFRYGINSLIERTAQFACPAKLQYFRRQAFLFSGIYAEGESTKDQLYMFVPEGFMQYDETSNPNGGMMKYLPFAGQGHGVNNYMTVNDLLDYGDKLLAPIVNSGDFKNMNGDILKAYGADGVLQLAYLPEFYSIVPTTDLAVLEQFKNADFLTYTPTTCQIIQDPNTNNLDMQVRWDFKNATQGALSEVVFSTLGTHVMNTILVEPNYLDVFERSRFMMTTGSFNSDTESYGWVNCTSEVPIHLKVWNLDVTTGIAYSNEILRINLISSTPTAQETKTAILQHSYLENFDFHPT